MGRERRAETRLGGATMVSVRILEPNAAAHLALLLAATDAVRAREADRIRRFAETAQARDVMGVFVAQRVTPVLTARLRALAPDAFDAATWRALDHHVEELRTRGMLQEMATGRIVASLAGDSIHAVPLKGAALSSRLHGHPGMRESDDIDVLVDVADLEPAAAAVAALGWTRRIEPVPGPRAGLPQLHLGIEHESPTMPRLELHWRVDWREERFSREALQRARAAGRRELDPIDELAALLLFYARDGFAGLKLALDVSAWWDRFGAELDDGGVAPLCARHVRLAAALRAAALSSERIVGVPAARVLPGIRPRRRELMAVRLANWDLSGDPQQVLANVRLVDGLLTFPRDLGRYAGRQLVPPPSVVRHYYGLPRGATVRTGVSRVAHLVKVLGRFLVAWRRLSRRGTWSPRPPRGATSRGGPGCTAPSAAGS